jgi:hypothetical protein
MGPCEKLWFGKWKWYLKPPRNQQKVNFFIMDGFVFDVVVFLVFCWDIVLNIPISENRRARNSFTLMFAADCEIRQRPNQPGCLQAPPVMFLRFISFISWMSVSRVDFPITYRDFQPWLTPGG